MLFEALVVDDVHPRGEDLRRAAVPLKQNTAIKHGAAVLVAEERADAVFLQVAEKRRHGVRRDTVLSEVLFTHHAQRVVQALFFQQCFKVHALVGFLLRLNLLQLEHFVLAGNDDGRLKPHVTHVTHKGKLQITVVAQPHFHPVAALDGYLGRAVPLDFLGSVRRHSSVSFSVSRVISTSVTFSSRQDFAPVISIFAVSLYIV